LLHFLPPIFRSPSETSLLLKSSSYRPAQPPFPTRRSSDLYHRQPFTPLKKTLIASGSTLPRALGNVDGMGGRSKILGGVVAGLRSEEHTSELQSRENIVCRLLLEKKKKAIKTQIGRAHS